MKNVKDYQLKKCIFKTYEEFEEDINEMFEHNVSFYCDYEGISFGWDEDFYVEDVLAVMSEYYGVEVTSIHIDDCDIVGIWICYR